MNEPEHLLKLRGLPNAVLAKELRGYVERTDLQVRSDGLAFAVEEAARRLDTTDTNVERLVEAARTILGWIQQSTPYQRGVDPLADRLRAALAPFVAREKPPTDRAGEEAGCG